MLNTLKKNPILVAVIAILILLILIVTIYRAYELGYKKGLDKKNQIIDSYDGAQYDDTNQDGQGDAAQNNFPPPLTAEDLIRWQGLGEEIKKYPGQFPGMGEIGILDDPGPSSNYTGSPEEE